MGESSGQIVVGVGQLWDVADQGGVEVAGDFDQIGPRARYSADDVEIEPDDAVGPAMHRDFAFVDDDVRRFGVNGGGAVGKALFQGGGRRGVQGVTPSGGLFQGAQAVIGAAVHVQDIGVGFQQAYSLGEALAQDGVGAQFRRDAVGSGDQGHAAGEQAFEQFVDDRRVADVVDVHLVQTQHAGLLGELSGDGLQRVFAAADGVHALMRKLHEPVEMQA